MEKEPKMQIIDDADKDPRNQQFADDRLRSFIERIERLEEEKKAVTSDITDVFGEAKSAGYDTKAMRTVLKLRKMSTADRDEQEYIVETYRRALDM